MESFKCVTLNQCKIGRKLEEKSKNYVQNKNITRIRLNYKKKKKKIMMIDQKRQNKNIYKYIEIY